MNVTYPESGSLPISGSTTMTTRPSMGSANWRAMWTARYVAGPKSVATPTRTGFAGSPTSRMTTPTSQYATYASVCPVTGWTDTETSCGKRPGPPVAPGSTYSASVLSDATGSVV